MKAAAIAAVAASVMLAACSGGSSGTASGTTTTAAATSTTTLVLTPTQRFQAQIAKDGVAYPPDKSVQVGNTLCQNVMSEGTRGVADTMTTYLLPTAQSRPGSISGNDLGVIIRDAAAILCPDQQPTVLAAIAQLRANGAGG